MIDSYKLYLLACATFNTQQGGHLRPQSNFISWVNEISIELFNELMEDWEKTNKVSDWLAPFLRTVNITIGSNSGSSYDIARFPSDYSRYSSARVIVHTGQEKGIACEKCDIVNGDTGECRKWQDEDDLAKEAKKIGNSTREYTVRKVDNTRFGAVMAHKRKGPTIDRPYITEYQGGYKVVPRGVGILVLDYFRLPVEATFVYTIDSNDLIVYNKSASVQLEWAEDVTATFVARLKKRYGSYTSQEDKYVQGEAERKQTT